MDRASMGIPKKRLNVGPCEQGWADYLAETQWWSSVNIDVEAEKDEARKPYAQLHHLLVSIGGSETCFAYEDPDLSEVMERGRFFPGKSKKIPGRRNCCHENSQRFFMENRSQMPDLRVCTGYALSSDGMWRCHSWLVNRDEKGIVVLESTVKRAGYFGFVLTEEESEKFCTNNH